MLQQIPSIYITLRMHRDCWKIFCKKPRRGINAMAVRSDSRGQKNSPKMSPACFCWWQKPMVSTKETHQARPWDYNIDIIYVKKCNKYKISKLNNVQIQPCYFWSIAHVFWSESQIWLLHIIATCGDTHNMSYLIHGRGHNVQDAPKKKNGAIKITSTLLF